MIEQLRERGEQIIAALEFAKLPADQLTATALIYLVTRMCAQARVPKKQFKQLIADEWSRQVRLRENYNATRSKLEASAAQSISHEMEASPQGQAEVGPGGPSGEHSGEMASGDSEGASGGAEGVPLEEGGFEEGT